MKVRRFKHRLGFSSLVVAAALFLGTCIAFAETISYEYDAMGRLTKTTYGNGTVVTYSYDTVGNRLKKTTVLGTGGTPRSQAYSDSSDGTARAILPGE
jgi:YD repeat-containing protein